MNLATRRSFFTLAGAGLGTTVLAACGAATTTTSGSPGGTTKAAAPAAGGQASNASAAKSKLSGSFEFWQPWPIEQPTHGGPIGWKQLMDGFNKTGDVKVNIVTPSGDLNTAIQTAVAGGTSPDGWQADQQWVLTWAAKGFSAPLDDLMKRDKWDKSQIFSSALETMSWSGKYWGMMQHPDIVFAWYSVSLMEQNGLDPKKLPINWTQLDELIQKMTKKTGDGFEFVGGIAYTWTAPQVVLPQANGAKLVSEDGRKAQLDTPEVMEAIEWEKENLKRLGSFDSVQAWRTTLPGGDNQKPGTTSGSNDMFGQKKMGVNVGGNWTADNIRRWDAKMTSPLKFAVGPIPSGPHGARDPKNNVYAGGILEVAAKGSAKKDLVWEFMKYTSSKEGGLNVQRNTADVCANKQAAFDKEIVDSPVTGIGRKDFLPLFDTSSGARTIKHPAVTEINGEYNKAVNAYLKDEAGNLRDALKEANRLAQEHIDVFWQQNPTAGQ